MNEEAEVWSAVASESATPLWSSMLHPQSAVVLSLAGAFHTIVFSEVVLSFGFPRFTRPMEPENSHAEARSPRR